jgi:hypothetical protein
VLVGCEYLLRSLGMMSVLSQLDSLDDFATEFHLQAIITVHEQI